MKHSRRERTYAFQRGRAAPRAWGLGDEGLDVDKRLREEGGEWVYSAGEMRHLLRQIDAEVKGVDKEIREQGPGVVDTDFFRGWIRWRQAWEDYFQETYSDWAARAWQGVTGGERVEAFADALHEYRRQFESFKADDGRAVKLRTPTVKQAKGSGRLLSAAAKELADDLKGAAKATQTSMLLVLGAVGVVLLISQRGKDK